MSQEINYTEEKRKRMEAGEKKTRIQTLQGAKLTEAELQLTIKSLTIATNTLNKMINDHGVNMTQPEIIRRLELIGEFSDLSQKLQKA